MDTGTIQDTQLSATRAWGTGLYRYHLCFWWLVSTTLLLLQSEHRSPRQESDREIHYTTVNCYVAMWE